MIGMACPTTVLRSVAIPNLSGHPVPRIPRITALTTRGAKAVTAYFLSPLSFIVQMQRTLLIGSSPLIPCGKTVSDSLLGK